MKNTDDAEIFVQFTGKHFTLPAEAVIRDQKRLILQLRNKSSEMSTNSIFFLDFSVFIEVFLICQNARKSYPNIFDTLTLQFKCHWNGPWASCFLSVTQKYELWQIMQVFWMVQHVCSFPLIRKIVLKIIYSYICCEP